MADVVICSIALLAGPAYFFLGSLSYFKYDYLGPVWSPPVPLSLLASLKFVMLSAILVFIARQVYCYLKWKKIYWFTILMVLITNCLFYLPLSFFQNKALFLHWTFRINHNLPYLMWIFCFCCLKFKERTSTKGSGFLAYLASPRRAFYFFGFLLFLTYLGHLGAVAAAGITHRPSIVEYYFLVLVIMHVYLDMIIWWNMAKIAREVLGETVQLSSASQNEPSFAINEE